MLIRALIVAAAVAQQPSQAPAPASPPAPQPAPEQPSKPTPKIAFPHPLITEVLFAVPTGTDGDASGDGSRDNAGDEFVELMNPHDKPIQLNGYAVCGKAAPPESKSSFTQLKFTFPPVELKPGEVVVVFNGHKQAWDGPVGDTARAPEKGYTKMSNARLFTMGNTNARVGFVNKNDYVMLLAPDGAKLHCIKWGEMKAPQGCPLVEEIPITGAASMARRTPASALEPHPEITGKRFSPGKFPYVMDEPKPTEAPAAAPKP